MSLQLAQTKIQEAPLALQLSLQLPRLTLPLPLHLPLHHYRYNPIATPVALFLPMLHLMLIGCRYFKIRLFRVVGVA